jgi:hypothetical protein
MKKIITVFIVTLLSTGNAFSQQSQPEGLYIVVGDLGVSSARNIEETKDYYDRFADYIFQKMRGRKEHRVAILSPVENKLVWQGTAQDFSTGAANVAERFTNLDYFDSRGNDHRGLAASDIKGTFELIKKLEKQYAPLEFSHIFMFSPFLDTRTAMTHAPTNKKGQKIYDISEVIKTNKTLLPNIISASDVEGIESRSAEFFWVDEEMQPVIDKIFRGSDVRYSIHTQSATRTLLD